MIEDITDAKVRQTLGGVFRFSTTGYAIQVNLTPSQAILMNTWKKKSDGQWESGSTDREVLQWIKRLKITVPADKKREYSVD